MADPERQLVEMLVAANRILSNEGVADAFGHVSIRSARHPDQFLLSCSRSPGNVQVRDIQRYRVDGTLLSRSSEKPYVEKVIHSAIYQARQDVQAVCHHHSEGVLPFAASGTAIRPILHAASVFWAGIGWFTGYDRASNLMVASDTEGRALVRALGERRAVILRNHGCVVVGESLPSAVLAAVYLDQNGRVQLQAQRLGRILALSRDEAHRASRVFLSPLVQQRVWDYWLGRLPAGWERSAGLTEAQQLVAQPTRQKTRLER